MKRYIIPFILITLMFFSCLSNADMSSNFKNAPIIGKIYDMDNLPCSDVKVEVDGKATYFTDINGKFFIGSLSRGLHTIRFIKEGFKEEVLEFNFLNISQAIYQKMISMDQILKKIEAAIDSKDMIEAINLIEEGQKIDDTNPLLNYLYGIYYFELEYWEEATIPLEKIKSDGYDEPHVYLTLVNIYEYEIQDYRKAYDNLLLYLELRDDKEQKLRLKIIEARLPKEEPPAEEPSGED